MMDRNGSFFVFTLASLIIVSTGTSGFAQADVRQSAGAALMPRRMAASSLDWDDGYYTTFRAYTDVYYYPNPTPTVTPTPKPVITPTPTSQPVATPTPVSSTDKPALLWKYEFEKSTLADCGWTDMPGGFTGKPAGSVATQNFASGWIASSADQKGLAISVDPGEVAFIYAKTPIQTNGRPVLLRLTLRSDGANAAVALAALKGNLSADGVDGSIATLIPASAQSFMAKERRITMMYEPDSGNILTPIIQVAASGTSGTVTVYVDKLEIFTLEDAFFASEVEPPSTITISLPNLPDGAKPLEMALIPAGTFMMGSPDTEQKRYSHEGPQHQVTITKPFYMGKYEITQAQWKAVMGNNPSTYKGNNLPVDTVSWEDCQTFIQKLNGLGQGTFRLSTEAEWEYACRAGSTTAFYWGEDSSFTEIANYAWYGDYPNGQTHEVGLKRPNAWGLYDMSGNLFEWCQDWYGNYSSSAQIDPTGAVSGSYHVVRGCSWINYPEELRSAYRSYGGPGYWGFCVGFRIVLENTPLPTKTPTPQITPSLMETIYNAIKIENLGTDQTIFTIGDQISIHYEFVNRSDSALIVPLNNQYSNPYYLVGVKQSWIERLGDDSSIPPLNYVTRSGSKYAVGGEIIIWSEVIKSQEKLECYVSLNTKGFPEGKYRYYVEYKRLDNHYVIMTVSFDFEL